MKKRLAQVIESYDREKRAGTIEFCGSPLLRPPKSDATDEARNHLLRRFGRDPGVFLAGTSGDEPCYLGMPEGEDGNILVVGGNGSGKTSSIAIPTLATRNGAIFALDIKGELGAAYTSLYQRGLKSRPALIFNLSDPACLGFDPFGWLIEDGADNVISNVWDLVCCLLPNSSNDSQPFWVEAERGVLAAALLYFFKRGLGFTEAICLTLEKSGSQLCAEIMENGDMEEKLFLGEVEEGRSEMFAGIDRGLRNRLILFAADPVISHTLRGTREGAACFSWDDLDHYNFFLQIPAEQIEEWSGVISLMCTQLIRHLERRADRFSPGGSKSPQLLLLLDEFPRFGKIECLTAAMSTLRSKGVNFCLIIQSLAQLDCIYGENERRIILDNCQYKAILQAADADTQAFLSELAGTCIRRYHSVGESLDSKYHPLGYSRQITEVREPQIFPYDFSTLQDIVLLTPFGICRGQKVRGKRMQALFDRMPRGGIYHPIRLLSDPIQDHRKGENCPMKSVEKRIGGARQKLEETKRQQRIAERAERAEKKKQRQRCIYQIGELVTCYFPELVQTEMEPSADRTEFSELEGVLSVLAADRELVDRLRARARQISGQTACDAADM